MASPAHGQMRSLMANSTHFNDARILCRYQDILPKVCVHVHNTKTQEKQVLNSGIIVKRE